MSRAVLVLLLFASALLAPTASEAYVRTRREADGKPVAWARSRVVFELARDTIPSELDIGQVEAAVRAALDAWDHSTVPCTALELSLGNEGGAAVARDGVQRIAFRRDLWCKNGIDSPLSCYSADELAMTTLHVDRGGGASANAEIVDADIELNAVHYRWSTGNEGPRRGNLRDLTRVLIHELGHALGLDHNCGDGLESHGPSVPRCRSAPRELRQATMFPSWRDTASSGRHIGRDERRAVCDLYPIRPAKSLAAAPAISAPPPPAEPPAIPVARTAGDALRGRAPQRELTRGNELSRVRDEPAALGPILFALAVLGARLGRRRGSKPRAP